MIALHSSLAYEKQRHAHTSPSLRRASNPFQKIDLTIQVKITKQQYIITDIDRVK